MAPLLTGGFWIARGAAASVDWCEPNYAVSPYVAEWWNTLSSLPLVFLGLYGLFRVRRARGIEARFWVCFAALAIIGAGSAAFHGTLLQVSQAADELPMVYGGLALLYCLLNRDGFDRPRERRWALGMGLYAAAFTAAYFTLDDYFSFFIGSYALIVAALVLGALRLAFVGPPGVARTLIIAACVSYLGGLVVFWLPEHVFLSCDHPLQALQLHAFWHLLAGVGTYLGILFGLWDRLARLQRAPALSRAGALPFVEPSRPQA